MSLRTSYSGALDAKLAEARDSGYDAVLVTNLADIAADMAAAAASGKKKFTVNFSVTYQPADLRLKGPLWEAYKTGVEQALASEDLMGNEATVELNTTDQLNTSIDIKFSF